MAGERARWAANVGAYTAAGAVSSILVGAALATAGRLVLPSEAWSAGVPIAVALALLAAARDLGWIWLPLPQPGRQTRGLWARIFGSRTAAALWGFDLGLFFTTRFTFSGAWLLVVLAILTRDARLGAALFLAYWLGRAAPVWLGPLLVSSARGTARLIDGVQSQYRIFQLIHVVAVAFMAAVLSLSFA